MRSWIIGTTFAVGLLATPAWAYSDCKNRVDLALVLAVDTSETMDKNEWQMQRDGYVAAFRNPDLLHAIASGPCGRIAVAYMQWSGYVEWDHATRWFVVSNEESMTGFARHIETTERLFSGSTSITGAIESATHLLTNKLPYEALLKKIDISGDGQDDGGTGATMSWEKPPPGVYLRTVWNRAVALGITINGLPIVNQTPPYGPYVEPSQDINSYYKDNVRTPDGFIRPANSIGEIKDAIYDKLVAEIAWAK